MTIFKFFDSQLKEEIDIPLEKWRWIATYKDGTEIHQFDFKTQRFHQFKEIEQARGMVLFSMVSEENPKGFRLMVPDGADLIHFYRNRVLNATIKDEVRQRFYVFGWKVLIDGESFKRMITIRPDDTIELSDK